MHTVMNTMISVDPPGRSDDPCPDTYYDDQGQVHINARSKAYESIRSGQPGYRHAYGMEYENVWDVLADEDRKSGTAKEGR